MKPYTIIFIREYFPSPENPSVSSWVYNQAKQIQKFGLIPIVVSPTPEVPWWIKIMIKTKYSWRIKSSDIIKDYLGVDVIRPSYLKLPNKYFIDYNIRETSKCIYKTARGIDAKLIHAHFGHAGIASLRLKNIIKLPLITSFYGYDLGNDKFRLAKYYKTLAREGDLFLALSNDMKKDLRELGFPENKIIVHHLGVDIEKFTPHDVMVAQKSIFKFTIVASFTERKGIHFVIKAFKKLKSQHKIENAQLRIVGDGTYKNNLLEIADNDKDVIFINNFTAADPRALVLEEMQSCDVFILTSITLPNKDKEGTPVVLMEAQACGKPCISTKHAGIPELVIDGLTGILVDEGNIDQIAQAMTLLNKDVDLRIKMGLEARKHIKNNFNNERQVELLNDIYIKLM